MMRSSPSVKKLFVSQLIYNKHKVIQKKKIDTFFITHVFNNNINRNSTLCIGGKSDTVNT